MNTKTVGMIFAVFLLAIPILACDDGGSSSSGGSKSSGSIERMSNLEIAREVMRCGIDNGQEVAKDLVIL